MLIGKREKMSEKSIKILETITIILIIAFALVSYIVSNYILKNERKNIAIYKKGVKITQVDGRRIDKNIDGIYMIGDKNSEYNIVEIKDKKI